MQALKTERAVPSLRAARRNGPKNERIGERLDRESTRPASDFQMIADVAADVVERLRVARLRRKFGLDADMATLLARIAFETTEAR